MFNFVKLFLLSLFILDNGINANYLRKYKDYEEQQNIEGLKLDINDNTIKTLNIFNCDNKPFCELKITFNNNSISEYWLLSKRISDEL